MCNEGCSLEPSSSSLYDPSYNISYSLSKFIAYNHFPTHRHAFLPAVTSCCAPKYYTQAIHDPKRHEPMAHDMNLKMTKVGI